MTIKSYRDLEVWHRSMDLVEAVYRLCEEPPDAEKYGLRSQAQQSAISIPSNIAEGFGRGSAVDYGRFVTIARGSLMELETQLALMVRLNLVDRQDVLPLWDKSQVVGKMLTSLRNSLGRKSALPKAQSPRPKA